MHPISVHVWKNVPSAAHACSCLWLTDALYMTHQLGTAGCLLLHCLHHRLSCCTEPWGVVGWVCRTPKYRSRLMSGRSFCPAPPYLMSGIPPGCMPTLQKWLPGRTRTSKMCFTPARSCTHDASHTACLVAMYSQQKASTVLFWTLQSLPILQCFPCITCSCSCLHLLTCGLVLKCADAQLEQHTTWPAVTTGVRCKLHDDQAGAL